MKESSVQPFPFASLCSFIAKASVGIQLLIKSWLISETAMNIQQLLTRWLVNN
jgi:hypothetical protein